MFILPGNQCVVITTCKPQHEYNYLESHGNEQRYFELQTGSSQSMDSFTVQLLHGTKLNH